MNLSWALGDRSTQRLNQMKYQFDENDDACLRQAVAAVQETVCHQRRAKKAQWAVIILDQDIILVL